jgi:hypothetical protein
MELCHVSFDVSYISGLLLLAESRKNHGSENETIKQVSSRLGLAEIVASVAAPGRGRRRCQAGMTSEEHAEIRRLWWENGELRQANEILESTSLRL